MPNINDFKSRLAGGGARANQFKVTLPFPGYSVVSFSTISGFSIANVPRMILSIPNLSNSSTK